MHARLPSRVRAERARPPAVASQHPRRGLLQRSSTRETPGRLEGARGRDGLLEGMLPQGDGRPLDSEVRGAMESHLDFDFSRVRIHADSEAAESARAMRARAYTTGWDLVFGESQYAPATREGRGLIAHELTHVVQQGGQAGLQRAPLKDGEEEVPLEAQAELVAAEVAMEQTGQAVPEEKKEAQEQVKKKPPAKSKPNCTRTILWEGTCEFLAQNSKWLCCDPANGFHRPGRKTSPAEPGKVCESEKWTPIFTCDHNCEKALAKGCSDNDNWMAAPKNQVACGEEFTICANGKQTKAYVRDRSETKKSFEVSSAVQKALGVEEGGSFKGSVYRPGAAQKIIDKDSCCKEQT